MDSAVSERVELAKFCCSRDWSKAIRVLDSLLAQSYAIQDICNRAFCYSQLELHKHVVKDCDKALQLDPMLLQAYILKGRAFSALGRKEEALAVWEQGYQYALRKSADLKQLLELEELLTVAKGKQGGIISSTNHKSESGLSVPESKAYMNGKSGQSDPVSESKAYMNGKSGLSVPVSDSKSYVNGKSNEDSEGQNKNVSLKLCSESMKVSVPVSESTAYMNGKSNEASEGQNKNVSLKLCSESMKVSEHRRSDSDHSCTTENGISEKMKGKSLLSESVHVTSAKSGNTFKGLSELSKVSLSSSNGKDDSEVNDDKCGDNFKTAGKLGDKTSANGNPSNGMNGTHGIDEMSNAAESLKDLCGESEQCSTSSMIVSNPRDATEVRFKSVNQSDSNGVTSNEGKRNKKFCIAKISKTKSISVDFRLSRGIAQVNEGNYANAISIFNQILREDPTYPEALIGRGTAYAFQRELEAAIADFSKALESNPSAGEAWKRRGQARAALGESVEAIRDLTKALEFEPNSADILHERGIVNFKFKDLHAAVEDLSECVKLDKDNKSAYTYLGSAYSSIGEYKMAEEAHLKSIQLDQSFIEAWASLTQFYQDLANSKKAMECVQRVLIIDASYAKAYHLRGLLLHGMGEHRKAIVDLSIGLSIEKSNVECLYLRGSCYHAIGEYREAAKDYDAALDVELDSMEKFVLQCLAFYQKEIALYTASKVSSDFCWFDIDGDIDPLFKEYWCKRLHPKNVCEKVYRQPTLRESLKKGKLKKQDFAITKQRTALLLAADSIGKRIQYECPGFLPNRRQHRMAGLAAIEIAQKVSKAWRSLRAELKNSNKGSKNGKRVRRKERISMASQNRGGACCSTSSSAETSTAYGITEDKLSGRSMMSWHDVYALAVRWRQISEPCDPVVWVNKLSEEFNSGFGSHTPMILGQAKVVRYFPNYERTLDKAKTIMKDKLYVNNKADKIINLAGVENSEKISNAKSCDDLYKIVGEDFWLATWCNSTAFEGKQLEGTRITLVKIGERGYDFAIRTPCTPSRWEEFDAEMALAWEALCNAYCGDTYGSTDFDALENVREAILRMTYYWYNFMPLSRGTAVVGFVVLLGLFLAANMEFTGSIPKGVQVDWEAILNLDPNSFVDSVKSWLYPSLKIKTSWKDNPDVASTFSTTGSVVAALSTYDD